MPNEYLRGARLCMTFWRNGKPPETRPGTRNADHSLGGEFLKKRPACGLATISPKGPARCATPPIASVRTKFSLKRLGMHNRKLFGGAGKARVKHPMPT